MRDVSWIKLFGRVPILTGIGLAIALFVGTLISYAPASPLEGFHGGVFVTGVLLVLVYFIVVRFRGAYKLKGWVFELHSALGLATGILLSVIFLSGVLLLYRGEIDVIANPSLDIKAGDSHASVNLWIDAVGTRTDLNVSNRIDISWPGSEDLPAQISVRGPNGIEQFYVDPYNARIIDGEFSSGMGLVRRLHVGLNMGMPGHWLVGLVALAAIWLCIGGLTMGRNVFRQWYLLRWGSGLRTLLSDLHKRIGLWLLPFIVLNAFAGMLAASFSVSSIGPVKARFAGNYDALYEAVGSPQSVLRHEPFDTPPLNEFVISAMAIMPGTSIRNMQVIGYGDRNAIVSIRADRPGDFAPDGSSLQLTIRATTGEILRRREVAKAGIFERISMALAAFHLAQYGGGGIRGLHAVTAVIISLLPFIGMAMWFFRRRRR